MNDADVITEFEDAGALLKGHFVLSSGLHSDTYMQCARVLMDTNRAERLCKALADKVKASNIEYDVVVAPAMGGVIVGYEMARQLAVPGMFVERSEGSFALRRGFALEAGHKVLIVEDVVTTGKSSMEAARCIEALGAKPVAVCSLVNRNSDQSALTLPLVSLLSLDIPTYAEADVPEALKAIEVTKPGSRFLKK